MSRTGRAGNRRGGTAHQLSGTRRAMEVTFLDVGHGFCTIIVTPRRRLVIMVDCKSGAGPLALDYLRESGLDDPSVVFISHMHDDHVAGFADIFKKLVDREATVERVFTNCVGPTTWKRSRRGGQAVVDRLREVLGNDERRLRDFARSGRPWRKDGLAFHILHPGKFDLHQHQDRDDMLNELSGVLRVDFGRSSLLLPGDIEGWAASKLVATAAHSLQSALLLFPHHGAGWEHAGPSGSALVRHGQDVVPPAAFVRTVGPAWTVVAAGSDNDGNWDRWHHPSPVIFCLLREWHRDSAGGFICTEATPHCHPLPEKRTDGVPCGGHVRFRLYEDGKIELAEPLFQKWRCTIRHLQSPQCVTPGGA